MKTNKKHDTITYLHQLYEIYQQEATQIISSNSWKKYSTASNKIFKTYKEFISFVNPRLNSLIWAIDVDKILRQIVYSYCWMNAHAKLYESKIELGSELHHRDFQVNYFADNCIMRLIACKDKFALSIWAYYIPFNPDQPIKTFKDIRKHLKSPENFFNNNNLTTEYPGIRINNQNVFLRYFDQIDNADFRFIENYRHIKIHRKEPNIELHKIRHFHRNDYILPNKSKNSKKDDNKKLSMIQDRSKREIERMMLEIDRKNCTFWGNYFEKKTLSKGLWEYNTVNKHIYASILTLLDSCKKYFYVLNRRINKMTDLSE